MLPDRPRDTSLSAATASASALDRLGPGGRVRAAMDLSDSVRSILLAGTLARNPGYTRSDAIHHIIREQHGLDLQAPG